MVSIRIWYNSGRDRTRQLNATSGHQQTATRTQITFLNYAPTSQDTTCQSGAEWKKSNMLSLLGLNNSYDPDI